MYQVRKAEIELESIFEIIGKLSVEVTALSQQGALSPEAAARLNGIIQTGVRLMEAKLENE